MKIVGANSFRDGGTTYISIDKGNKRVVEYQIDYSLPHDGRPRKIGRLYRNDKVSEYEIGSEEEKRVCTLVRELAEEALGKESIDKLLSGEDAGSTYLFWGYVCGFLLICQREGKFA